MLLHMVLAAVETLSRQVSRHISVVITVTRSVAAVANTLCGPLGI